MKYINFKSCYGIETVDEFKTIKEAREMAKEYNLSDSSNHYYISQKCTKEWSKK